MSENYVNEVDEFISEMSLSRAEAVNLYSELCVEYMAAGEVARFLRPDGKIEKELQGVPVYERQMEEYDHFIYKKLKKMKKFLDSNQNHTFKKIDKTVSKLSIENKKFVDVATFVSTVARRFSDFNERTHGTLDNVKVYDLDALNSLLLYGEKLIDTLKDIAVDFEEIVQIKSTDPVEIKMKYDRILSKYTDKSGKVVDLVQYVSELEKFRDSDEVKGYLKDFKLHLVDKPIEVLQYIEDLGYMSATEIDQVFSKIRELHHEMSVVRKDIDKRTKELFSKNTYVGSLDNRNVSLNNIPTANAQGMVIETIEIMSIVLSKMTSRYISVVQGITLLLGNAHNVSKEILNTEVFKQLRKGGLDL